MKYYFLVNPISGKGNATKILEKVKLDLKIKDIDYQIIVTEYQHHAISIVKRIAQTGEKCRIFACGGDGTLFDVVNGAYGYDNVEIGVIPCGSGNDFIKNFKNESAFLDINDQISGKSDYIDLIKFEDKYCINIASMGLDANVVAKKNNMQFLSKISGKFAYMISVIITFITNMQSRFKVKIDDLPLIDKQLLFVVVSNGRFYGGSFNPTPNAIINDGKIDVMTMNPVKKLQVFKLLTKYQKGLHINIPDLCEIKRCNSVSVEAEKEIPINLDGEIFYSKKAKFDIIKQGIKFIIPYSLTKEINKSEGEFALF